MNFDGFATVKPLRAAPYHYRTDAADTRAVPHVHEILVRVRIGKYFGAGNPEAFAVGRRVVVRSVVAEPASGSVIATAMTSSPRNSGLRYRSF
jgi:hypothetical protein